MNKLSYSLIFFLIGILIGGSLIYYQVKPSATSKNEDLAGCKIGSDSDLEEELKKKTELSKSDLEAALSYLKFKKIRESVIPSGSPDYSSELEVSYDQASQAVNKLANLEQEIGLDNLNGEEKERYIKIGTTKGTACEFCCGAREGFARSNGQRVCGCAHNIALSGLTMWMLKNSYSNEEILEEIAKWKALFFPKQTLTRELQEMKKDDPEVQKLLEEFPAFLPQMVGGC